MPPDSQFGVYDYMNSVFDRTCQELLSCERTFNECNPYISHLTEEQKEVIHSHQEALKRALTTIQKPPA